MGSKSTPAPPPTVTQVSTQNPQQQAWMSALYNYMMGSPDVPAHWDLSQMQGNWTPSQDSSGKWMWTDDQGNVSYNAPQGAVWDPDKPGTPSQIGVGVSPYPGKSVPGATSIDTAAFNYMQNLLSGADPTQAMATKGLQSTLTPWDPLQSLQTWQQAVQGPTMQNWQQNILPGIQEQFAGMDAGLGGDAAKTITQAGANVETGLAQSLGTWQQQGQQDTIKNILQGVGLQDLVGTNMVQTGLGAGGTQYDILANQLKAAEEKWSYSQPYNNPWVDLGTGMLNLSTLENIVQPATQTNLAGSAGSLMSGMGMMGLMAKYLCCFIFIEANGGTLHPIVRRYRDEHMTERNRRGYYRLAERLVPWMKKSKAVHKAVEWCMTRPMTSYGKYFYGLNKAGALAAPITALWLTVFNLLGFGKFKRRNGEVI